jgi:uncharacterized protein (UPF0276 family)
VLHQHLRDLAQAIEVADGAEQHRAIIHERSVATVIARRGRRCYRRGAVESLDVKLSRLPRLGVGISAEPGSAQRGIDALRFRAERPGLIHFLEYGADVARGLDEHVRRWAAEGLPVTYHFLDLNLEERADVDDAWLAATAGMARELGAAWLCGDAGRWHFGPRDRGQQILLPPILTRDSALELADSIARVEEATGMACLPENPPSHFYLGDMHILDYFALASERAGCGLLLDCAHLAIFQRLRGHRPLDGLDGFPLDRVVEMHVAGAHAFEVDGLTLVEDDHSPEPLPDTLEILDHVLPHTRNLKAIVFECEKNPAADVVEGFVALNRCFPTGAP